MDAQQRAIIEGATKLAGELPSGTVYALALAIEQAADTTSVATLRAEALRAVPQPAQRARVRQFLESWITHAPQIPGAMIALALRTAALSMRHARETQRVELVWTGPLAVGVSMRRTDQALLQVITSAQVSLLIVSFAVYKIQAIADAIVQAADRGVNIRICIEAPEPSGQRMALDTIKALGQRVAQRAAIYVWPSDQRPTDNHGNTGVLHAKCAVADSRLLFVSSANLTDHAMHLNIELGTLIEGGSAPGTVVAQFEQMIGVNVLKQMEIT